MADIKAIAEELVNLTVKEVNESLVHNLTMLWLCAAMYSSRNSRTTVLHGA